MGWAQPGETPFGSRPPFYVEFSGCVVASGRVASALLGGFIAIGAAVGCTDAPNPPPPCGEPTPAFRFEVTTVQAPLPDGLRLRVEFGGAQTEAYDVGATNVGEVACCVTVERVGDAPAHIPCGTTIQSDAAVAPNAVVCDLWTNGAVNLSVLMSSHVLVEQTLHAKLLDEKSNCGQFETLTAQWVLGDNDAGVVVQP